MKKVLITLALIIMTFVIWFNLRKRSVSNISPPAQNLPTNVETIQPSTTTSNTSIASQPVASVGIPPAEMLNALTATNLEQWKMMVNGLHYSDKFGDEKHHGWESWLMTQKDLKTSIPIKVEANGQVLFYEANFVIVKALIGSGEIQSVQMHSPKMNIEETQTLGLQLCKMLQIEPKEFLDWSGAVGNHWLDAPLFSTGASSFAFAIQRTYNDEKPWYIRVIIRHRP